MLALVTQPDVCNPPIAEIRTDSLPPFFAMWRNRTAGQERRLRTWRITWVAAASGKIKGTNVRRDLVKAQNLLNEPG
jgi:hypothetical protein